MAIVATIGTTSSTAIDPVAAIADIAEREGLWLHVDSAYAGVVALLPDRRDDFAGWERADSIVTNPHKWLFTPLDASLLLTRRMTDLRAAFSLVPEYLRTLDRETPVRDYNEYTPQLGRRFRALKLWIQLRWFGLDGLRRRIERHIEMAQTFAAWVDTTPGLGAPGAGPVLDGLFPLATGRLGSRGARRRQRTDHGRGEPDRRDLPVAHPTRRPIHDPTVGREPANGAESRRAGLGSVARGRGRRSAARVDRMTITAGADLSDRFANARAAVEALEPGDAFEPAVPAAIVASGLHLAAVPTDFGGDGAGLADVVPILTTLGCDRRG